MKVRLTASATLTLPPDASVNEDGSITLDTIPNEAGETRRVTLQPILCLYDTDQMASLNEMQAERVFPVTFEEYHEPVTQEE